ncbi:MAG: hypothetical protein IKN87_03435 [Bacilli bacterium]|nr:hypothetical protein [Bacilli bacterium]
MKKMRNAILIGLALITISIIIAILYQPDNISFIIAGIGIIVIGCAFLSYINRPKSK